MSQMTAQPNQSVLLPVFFLSEVVEIIPSARLCTSSMSSRLPLGFTFPCERTNLKSLDVQPCVRVQGREFVQ